MTTTDTSQTKTSQTKTPQTTARPTADSGARVSLKPACEHRGVVQGAWWPRSRDLAVELPPLIAVLDENWTQITRATVNVTMWPDIPHVLHTGGHNVHVGWFDAEQQPDDICVLTYLAGRWDLLVVPPETHPDRAAMLMATAADVANHQTSSALLAEAGA